MAGLVNTAKFLRTAFFIEHLWWLLLYLDTHHAVIFNALELILVSVFYGCKAIQKKSFTGVLQNSWFWKTSGMERLFLRSFEHWSATLLNKGLNCRCFSLNFAKILSLNLTALVNVFRIYMASIQIFWPKYKKTINIY